MAFAYRMEEGVARLLGRLVPPSSAWPDCFCDLFLTQWTLFVLEQEPDESYTEHFVIPLERIREINILSAKPPGEMALHVAASAIVGVITGFMMLSRDIERYEESLCVRYEDGAGQEQSVHFRELVGSPRRFVSAWQRLRSTAHTGPDIP